MTPKEVVEIGLGSIGKIKILKVLAEENKMATLYSLEKKTRLKRMDIKNNLDDLVRIGWVKEVKYANALYGLEIENDYVKRLIQFFRDVGYTSQL